METTPTYPPTTSTTTVPPTSPPPGTAETGDNLILPVAGFALGALLIGAAILRKVKVVN